ncbi:MAG: Bug family tripartite tricarboxylate transporter substrate binding protein [Bordetella sp.]|uniref:Bug family tripartite tricarboxylate transporter substrate binding protein n=1 Tax=Bordetella sp. TaxID=28081 RepID=UPI003F7B5B7D
MPTRYSKLRLLAAMAPAMLALLVPPAHADGYPSKPIRFIVPFSAGGQLDYVARLVAKPMSRNLGQSVIVENDSGAAGTVAGAKVAIAAPDGYTLLEYGENFPIAKHLMPHLAYDPVGAFAMVSGISLSPHIILVSTQLPVHTLRELAAYGKAHPGILSYGSPGLGSSMNLTFEMIKRHFGIDAVHVPYRGGANMLTDLAGGQINVGVIAVSPAMPLIKSGKVRAIAITSANRDAALPDVPTVAESGYPDYNSGSWAGVAVPKGTPSAVISRLNQAVLAALADPQVKQALQSQSFTAIGGTPEQLTHRVRRESDRYGPLIEKLGLHAN